VHGMSVVKMVHVQVRKVVFMFYITVRTTSLVYNCMAGYRLAYDKKTCIML
jgi:hypothetical protein